MRILHISLCQTFSIPNSLATVVPDEVDIPMSPSSGLISPRHLKDHREVNLDLMISERELPTVLHEIHKDGDHHVDEGMLRGFLAVAIYVCGLIDGKLLCKTMICNRAKFFLYSTNIGKSVEIPPAARINQCNQGFILSCLPYRS